MVVDRTYSFTSEHTRALVIWQEMVLHALNALDERGRSQFTVMLDRPVQVGNVQVTFTKVPKT